ncbi:MAG TPA: flavin oxidoreductase/NADH oxidase [Clostridiales bacterium]|nr:flavin oxidoreductase/NADH oxidase [Clostridiales bacterium]
MKREVFKFKNFDEFKEDIEKLGANIPVSENLEIFKTKVILGDKTAPNSIALNPMEGCDALPDGTPSELSIRRFDRYSKGGAGLIWMEAVAVVHEGKANPRQFLINSDNLGAYEKLMDQMCENAQKAFNHKPVVIMQLTHSGRFSRPDDKPEPVLACRVPVLDEKYGLDDSVRIITDDELERLEEEFVKAAVLAEKAGYDGVDIKSCHRYLISGLLAAHTRPGKYGGDFEGRTRFLLNVIDKVKDATGKDFLVTCRLNGYDGIEYPYGFGVSKEDPLVPDFSEPVKLLNILEDKGVRLVNITMGTPYFNPHVNRPYDGGGYIPPEHPIKGVERLIQGIGTLKSQTKNMAFVSTGYSWLREMAQYVGAGILEKRLADFIGFGRQSFAYPDMANDLLYQGGMQRKKCCIACSKCTELMRADTVTGCVVKDKEVYVPIYKRDVK